MSISIKQFPGLLSLPAAHNPIWVTCTSDNSHNLAYTDFRYVFDLRDYNTGAFLIRVKVVPTSYIVDFGAGPTDQLLGVFDPSPFIRGLFSNYFQEIDFTNILALDTLSWMTDHVVQIGEEYGGTTYPGLTNLELQSYNWYQSAYPGSDAMTTDGLPAFKNRFLTQRDRTAIVMRNNGTMLFPFFNYDQDDFIICIYTPRIGEVNFSANGAVNTLNEILINPAILTHFGVDSSLDSFFEIRIRHSDTVALIDALRVSFKCNRFEPVTLHFLNRLGGYESFTFDLVNKPSIDVTAKQFTQRLANPASSSSVVLGMKNYSANGAYNNSITTYAIDQAHSYKLASDWLTETDYHWLNQLITSPQIYLEKAGYFYPVNMTTTNWEKKLYTIDKLFNLELQISLGHTVNSQYQ